jgi:predicted dinucleotide-utilizing enzyme
MKKTRIAILGFGKVGQTIFNTIQSQDAFGEAFQVTALWNRTFSAFEGWDFPDEVKLFAHIKDLMQQLEEIDLLIECSHASILKKYAADIVQKTNLFISSPAAFGDAAFKLGLEQALQRSNFNCYLPLGASVGLWDVLRLDQANSLKSLEVIMKKHPDSFKIDEPKVVERMKYALNNAKPIKIFSGSIDLINQIAPQNTNTMAIYALAARSLGFSNCTGQLIADASLEAHIVELKVETIGGLKIHLIRDNPAQPDAVTGKATFGSFLNSLLHYQKGILHHHFTFC